MLPRNLLSFSSHSLLTSPKPEDAFSYRFSKKEAKYRLAAEAIAKIKQVEEEADKLISAASDKARQILQDGQKSALAEKQKILDEYEAERVKAIQTAEQQAREKAAPEVAAAKKQLAGILNPDAQKIEKAISLITERIVDANVDR